MGYSYAAGHIDGDGICDLIVSSPTADGIDYGRGNSGEVNIIYGNPISIDGISLSGDGAVGSDVLCCGGRFNINVTYHSDRSELFPEEMVIRFSPSRSDVTAVIHPDGIRLYNDPDQSLMVFNDSLKAGNSATGKWLSFDASMGWSFPANGPVDLLVELVNQHRFIRSFDKHIRVCKNIRHSDDISVSMGDVPYEARGGWAGFDEEVVFSSFEAYYVDVPEISVQYGSVDLILSCGGEEVDRSSFDGGMYLVHRIADREKAVYTISVDYGLPDIGLKARYDPDPGPPIELCIMVDSIKPDAVDNLTVIHGSWPDDDIVNISWTHDIGNQGDSCGAGIRSNRVVFQDGTAIVPMDSGGLWGTYFSNEKFQNEVYGKLDTTMDFDWGYWGPDPELIPPIGYSIRWHGWFHQQYRNPAHFHAEGSGTLSVYLNGECLVDWMDLDQGVDSEMIDIGEGNYGELIILYRCSGGNGSLRLYYEDPLGSIVPLGDDSAYYPSNITHISLDREMVLNATVVSIDWVDLRSEKNTGGYYYDLTPPIIDLSEIPNWLSQTRVCLDAGFIDPEYNGEVGSGLSPDSISYRIKSDREPYGDWRYDNLSIEDWTFNGLDGLRAKVKTTLDKDFNGIIQFRVVDISGNVNVSQECSIAVDLIPPHLTVEKPTSGYHSGYDSLSLFLVVHEIIGSGPDPDHCFFRYRYEKGTWSTWLYLNTTMKKSEVSASGILECGYGNHSIQFMGMDRAGNSNVTEEIEISFNQPIENMPPVPKIRYPKNGSVFHVFDEIVFDASGTSDDGIGSYDQTILSWFSNISGFLGTGGIINIHLEEGKHRIVLFVDDGSEGHNVSTHVDITVIGINEENDDNPYVKPESPEDGYKEFPLAMIVVFLIILFLGIIAFLIISMHSKNNREVRLDITEIDRSGGDDDR